MVETRCLGCGERIRATDRTAGHAVMCRRCGATARLPAPRLVNFSAADAVPSPAVGPPRGAGVPAWAWCVIVFGGGALVSLYVAVALLSNPTPEAAPNPSLELARKIEVRPYTFRPSAQDYHRLNGDVYNGNDVPVRVELKFTARDTQGHPVIVETFWPASSQAIPPKRLWSFSHVVFARQSSFVRETTTLEVISAETLRD